MNLEIHYPFDLDGKTAFCTGGNRDLRDTMAAGQAGAVDSAVIVRHCKTKTHSSSDAMAEAGGKPSLIAADVSTEAA